MGPVGEAACLVGAVVLLVVACGGLVGMGVCLGRAMLDDRVAELEHVETGLREALDAEEREDLAATMSRTKEAEGDARIDAAVAGVGGARDRLRNLRLLLPARRRNPAPPPMAPA